MDLTAHFFVEESLALSAHLSVGMDGWDVLVSGELFVVVHDKTSSVSYRCHSPGPGMSFSSSLKALCQTCFEFGILIV